MKLTKKQLRELELAKIQKSLQFQEQKEKFLDSQPIYLQDMISIRDTLSNLTKDIVALANINSPDLSKHITQISKLFPLIIQCNKLIQDKEVNDRLASDAEVSRQTIFDVLQKADQLRKNKND